MPEKSIKRIQQAERLMKNLGQVYKASMAQSLIKKLDRTERNRVDEDD